MGLNLKLERYRWVNVKETNGLFTLSYKNSTAMIELDTRSMTITNIMCADRYLIFTIQRQQQELMCQIADILSDEDNHDHMIYLSVKTYDFK